MLPAATPLVLAITLKCSFFRPTKNLFAFHIPISSAGIVSSVLKEDEMPLRLRDSAQSLFRGAERAKKRAKEMIRQSKSLESDMKRTEANLRATQRALQRAERKAGRLHRRLRGWPFAGQ